MYFALFMLAILAVTGFIWLLDILILRKKRAADAAEPVLVEYAKSFSRLSFWCFLCALSSLSPSKFRLGP